MANKAILFQVTLNRRNIELSTPDLTAISTLFNTNFGIRRSYYSIFMFSPEG